MKKTLDDRILIRYVKKAAQKLGVSIPAPKDILRQMNLKIPQPILAENSRCQLWIDKFYIAYSGCDEKIIHYVYLTKEHICEEFESYKTARKQRRRRVYLPVIVNNTFTAALKNMRDTGQDYYLDKDFFKLYRKSQQKSENVRKKCDIMVSSR